MASGLWGFENVPEMYVPRGRANPIGESIGGGIGQIFAAVAQGKQADAQRAMALKRMQQEQGQFDARMGMDRDRMGEESRRAAATLAMNEKHNAAQEANWGDERAQRKATFDALQAEKQGQRQAAPISGTIEGLKDISQEPEMAGVNSLLQTGQRQAMESNSVTAPRFATRGGMPNQRLQDAFARGSDNPMDTVSPDQFTRDIAPNVADAAGDARSRMSVDKQRAAYAGRTPQADLLERDRRRMIMQSLIEAEKAGREPDPFTLSILADDPKLQADFNAYRANRKTGLQGLPEKFNDPATFAKRPALGGGSFALPPGPIKAVPPGEVKKILDAHAEKGLPPPSEDKIMSIYMAAQKRKGL